MSIVPETLYPGKTTPSSASYPFGSARDVTVPGDGTGTPWVSSLVNDFWGFFQALLTEGSVVPSGSPDTALVSQYVEAMKTVTKANITALVLDGQTGDPVRPKGQLVFKSDEADPISHAILSGQILNSDDEGALEFLVKFDDALSRQVSADFTRTLDDGAGAGDFPTARVVNAKHINSGAKGDTTPFAVWDGNSCGVCLGVTSGLPWEDLPLADDMFFVGGQGNQFQILTENPTGEITMQAFNITGGVFNNLVINALEIEFGQGDFVPDLDDTRSIGSASKKIARVWATDAALDSLSLGGAVTVLTGVGSPEGVESAATGSMYTNQSGGAGLTLWVKESSPTANTGWVAK